MMVDAEMTKVRRLYMDWLATTIRVTQCVKWLNTSSITSRINVRVALSISLENWYILNSGWLRCDSSEQKSFVSIVSKLKLKHFLTPTELD